MTYPYVIRWILTLAVLLLAANIPFLFVGMFWAAPAIFVLSLWFSFHWNYHDSMIFIMLKMLFLGFFCVATMEFIRQYPVMEESGLKEYLRMLQVTILFAIPSLFSACVIMGFLHKFLHLIDWIYKKISRFIQKEMEKYHRTWIYRRYFKFMKKLRGLAWRIHNFLLKIKTFFSR